MSEGVNKDLGATLEDAVEMLMDNFLLAGVVIITVEALENKSTEIRASTRGGHHQAIGMLRDYESQLLSSRWRSME